MIKANKDQITVFKKLRIVNTRNITGDAYKAEGCYDEVANICGQEVHIKCTITSQDVDRYRFAS